METLLQILISGGAGFVGSSLALAFKEKFPKAKITTFDNLKRRGSESNIQILKEKDISFVHGDIRNRSDLFELPGNFDLFIEASAEASVHAGSHGSPDYVLQTNLCGTLNCLEYARKRVDTTIFLSTSRVYSIKALREIKLDEADTRFEISEDNKIRGLSKKGIKENFSTSTARSLYGASKLASELIAQEYADTYKTKILINRCGVIAGPGQFGKVDQGVFTMWVANHYFLKPLKYMGFGGFGKQVRDLLHPSDLFELICLQIEKGKEKAGEIYNVGGGKNCSTSLLELSKICQELTGNEVPISSQDRTSPVDIPLYLTDTTKVYDTFNWQTKKNVQTIISDIYLWLEKNEKRLKEIFC